MKRQSSAARDRKAFEAWLDPTSLVKGGHVTANWLDGSRFWYVEGAPQDTAIQVFDPASGTASPLFETGKVRKAYRKALGREAPWRGLPFDAIRPAANGGFMVSMEGRDYRIDALGEAFAPAPGPNMAEAMFGIGAAHIPETYVRPGTWADRFPSPAMLSPDGRWFSSIRDHDVWLRSTADGRRERLTFDGEPLNGWDVESVRRAPGPGGQVLTFATSPWAPDSLKLFATRFDERGILPWVRVRWGERSDAVENTYFARSGDRLPSAAPHVIDILRRTSVRIDVPVEDRLLLPIGWSGDAAAVFFAQFSRDMSWAGVWRGDAQTGAARLLFEERADTFLRLQHDVIGGRSGCTQLPDGGFLWTSARDGWNHLHHYDAAGAYMRQLTSGEWPVMDVQAVDAAAGYVYFTAHHDRDRPYDIHLCRAPLAGGAVQRLTDGAGAHEAQISPDRTVFVDTVSRPDLPPQSVVRRTSGELLHHLPPADVSALDALGWTRPEVASVKAADGETDLWAVIYKPPDFDPARSYPVIEAIYAGPQVTMASHYFALFPYKLYALHQALPQLGYIVVTLDARGTPERSKAFLDVTYKDWRRHVTADHAAALHNLGKDRPWMDLERVGIWGHSWGGYFTFANLIDNPELFRAGLCSAPGFDPYDGFIYEPYLGGVPSADNRAAYEDAYLFHDADKLKGELMIVAGTNDMGVWQSSVRMTEALIRAAKPHEFVVLPGQHHAYDTAHDDYFVEKLVGFFDRTVKNAGKRSEARA